MFGEFILFKLLWKKVWEINRSYKGLLIVTSTLDGFSLVNRRQFDDLSTHQTFPLYSRAKIWWWKVQWIWQMASNLSKNLPVNSSLLMFILWNLRSICQSFALHNSMHTSFVKSFPYQTIQYLTFSARPWVKYIGTLRFILSLKIKVYNDSVDHRQTYRQADTYQSVSNKMHSSWARPRANTGINTFPPFSTHSNSFLRKSLSLHLYKILSIHSKEFVICL